MAPPADERGALVAQRAWADASGKAAAHAAPAAYLRCRIRRKVIESAGKV